MSKPWWSEKYRLRTYLRSRAPWAISMRIPKGKNCGEENHAWHLHKEGEWRCYHCETGVSYENPWSPVEQLEIKTATVSTIANHIQYRGYPSRLDQEALRKTIPELKELLESEEIQGLYEKPVEEEKNL